MGTVINIRGKPPPREADGRKGDGCSWPLHPTTDIPYMNAVLHAVVETAAFLRDAGAAGMSEAERLALVDILAANPDAGDLMPGTGGARKLRWRRPGAGKSGGYAW